MVEVVSPFTLCFITWIDVYFHLIFFPPRRFRLHSISPYYPSIFPSLTPSFHHRTFSRSSKTQTKWMQTTHMHRIVLPCLAINHCTSIHYTLPRFSYIVSSFLLEDRYLLVCRVWWLFLFSSSPFLFPHKRRLGVGPVSSHPALSVMWRGVTPIFGSSIYRLSNSSHTIKWTVYLESLNRNPVIALVHQ